MCNTGGMEALMVFCEWLSDGESDCQWYRDDQGNAEARCECAWYGQVRGW